MCLLILSLLFLLLCRWISYLKSTIALVYTVSEVLRDIVVAQNCHTVLVIDCHGGNLDAAVVELWLVFSLD